jgi:hypothetical protein
MAAWGYLAPASTLCGWQTSIESASLPFTGAFPIDSVLIIGSGVLSLAATNPTTAALAGLSLKDAADIYYTASPTAGTLFGGSTVGTALTPSEPLNMQYCPFHNGNEFEFSIVQALAATTPGSTFGLLLDSVSGFWVLDSSQANKPWVVKDVVVNALMPWVIGDTGARVIAAIPSSTAIGI